MVTLGADGHDCIARIHNMDASRMTRDQLGSGFTQLPMIKLTIVDLPQVSLSQLSSDAYWKPFEGLSLL